MKTATLMSRTLLALVAATALSWSQTGPGRGPGGMGGGEARMMAGAPMAPASGLNNATRIKVLDQQIAFVRNTAELRTDLAVRRLELQKLLLAAQPDSIAIDSKYAEIGRIQNELEQAALLSTTAMAKLVPDKERGRYSLSMMNYGVMDGYGVGNGMVSGYGVGYGVPRGYCPYCVMVGTDPGSGGFNWW
jgi:Spy/CpxP family protein refolding chaperone